MKEVSIAAIVAVVVVDVATAGPVTHAKLAETILELVSY